jgi:hypothetical protein
MATRIQVSIDPEWEEDKRAENEHDALVWLNNRRNDNIITLPPDHYWEDGEFHSEL